MNAPKNSTKTAALPIIIGVALLVLVFDQISKVLVTQVVPMWSSWSLTPELGRLVRVTVIANTGAAFGMFPQLSSLFLVIAIAVVAGIIIFHQQLPIENGWIRLALGLQLGGALGNLTDRLVRGYVVDFIDIGFWPIFNVADVSIVVGVGILAYFMINEEQTLTEHTAGL
jgi:signal peptidase II